MIVFGKFDEFSWKKSWRVFDYVWGYLFIADFINIIAEILFFFR